VPGFDEARKSITGPAQTVFFSVGDSDRCVTRDGIIVRQFSLGFIVAVLFKTRSFRKDSRIDLRTEINEPRHYKAEIYHVSLLIERFILVFFLFSMQTRVHLIGISGDCLLQLYVASSFPLHRDSEVLPRTLSGNIKSSPSKLKIREPGG
jgi:hypothetical protein